ncbi:unnamed protein product [Effrenium voratum]|nr:unnamed protein product [Effrenium voratum]
MDALHGDGREKLVCAKKQMQDEDALQLQSLLGPSLSYREVDFSVNELTARGMGAVVDICKRSRRLQVLKLYRNRISDDCVEHFADLLRACPGLREVHLSHNLLSHEGVLQLAACVERRAEPLWLRVEQNTFTEPGGGSADLRFLFKVIFCDSWRRTTAFAHGWTPALSFGAQRAKQCTSHFWASATRFEAKR